jgi:hypothetical protein
MAIVSNKGQGKGERVVAISFNDYAVTYGAKRRNEGGEREGEACEEDASQCFQTWPTSFPLPS